MTNPLEANRGPRRPDFLIRELRALRQAVAVIERRIASYAGTYARTDDIPNSATGFALDGDQLTITFADGSTQTLTLPSDGTSSG